MIIQIFYVHLVNKQKKKAILISLVAYHSVFVIIECPYPSFDTSPKYQFKITGASLHCPIGHLSSDLFEKYEMQLQKRNAVLRLRRWIVKVQPVTKGTTLFETNILFGYDNSSIEYLIAESGFKF